MLDRESNINVQYIRIHMSLSKDSVSYELRTKYGKFQVTFSARRDRNTNAVVEFTVTVGSKRMECIQLTVPTKETGKTEAKLLWVESDDACSMERYIEKGMAQHMVLIGLTLIRLINSSVKRVTFDDTSSFSCTVPTSMNYLRKKTSNNDGKLTVPMKPFHIAFHEATWYEYYFDAKLVKDHEKYIKLKENMHNPNNKPIRKKENKEPPFNFINKQLQEELTPLYDNTRTWYEFFQAIEKKYKKDKCAVIYPWLTSAMSMIFEGNLYETPKWYIDLEENAQKNKTPMLNIHPTRNLKRITGGRRHTRKNRKGSKFSYDKIYLFPHIRKIQEWDYKGFLSRPRED